MPSPCGSGPCPRRPRHLLALALLLIASATSAAPTLKVEVVAEGLAHPWSLAFLPDGRMLVTERNGGLRVVDGGKLSAPVAGLPPVFAQGQGGLFEVLPARDFAKSRVLYLSFAHGDSGANATRVVRARLDGHALADVTPVFTAQPLKSGSHHFGGRLAWLADGTLLVTLGDGNRYRDQVQRLDSHLGKVVRINADGSVPKDNPFVARKDALPQIWSYGHRNVQGLAVDGAGKRVYAHEHGARGGDELNLLQPGRNYGWPEITFGREYSGLSITPHTAKPGMEQPLTHWTPSIAPGGMALYDGAMFPEWRGDLLVAALVEQTLRRVDLEAGQVKGQEIVELPGVRERLRDVRVGPRGEIYLLTDTDSGKILRISRP